MRDLLLVPFPNGLRASVASTIKQNALVGFQGLMLQHCPMKHNSFLRPLKKKGFKEERVTTIGLDEMGTSHDPGIQQEPPDVSAALCAI